MTASRLSPLLFLLPLLASMPVPLGAQVPSFREVTGHEFGDRITLHHEMVSYVQRLAEASPRVQAIVQGRSWEGRAFILAIVTAPENHARLEAIQEASRRLSDARSTSPAEAEELIRTQPVIVWFGGSIHGFELSGAEGALKLLEHLATRDDPATRRVLAETVVLIDPMLNPDGRDAFAHLNHENVGTVPSSDVRDWSNDFSGWQATKFRTGHYYFDTNRDWFAHTQMETRERMPTLHAWRPQVAVDMHEMGSGTEFYFDPPGPPYNPNFPQFARDWFQRFGTAYAQAFDSAGFEFMTRERYNYFYPGYTSNRGYQGAVAMLFEQGSSRGLALERPDGSVRMLRDALEQQYVAAWTAAHTAALNRQQLLSDYYGSQAAILDVPAAAPRRYLIANEGDPLLVSELVQLLRRNNVEVSVLGSEATLSNVRDRTGSPIGRRTFAVGTYVVDAVQPATRMLRTLLDPETPLPEDFLVAARQRVERAENPRFYDITGWSLPLLFNVGGYSSTDGRMLPLRALEPSTAVRGGVSGEAVASDPPVGSWVQAGYAYVLDGRSAASLAVLYHLKKAGYRAAVITAPTRIAGREISGGSVIVRVGQNDDTVHDALRALVERYGVDVYPMQSGLADAGYPSLGSGDFTFNVAEPKIAVLAEDPVFAYSFGWAWYTLDRQHEMPVTVLRAGQVDGSDLAHYNVLVIPSASAERLEETLGETTVERLRQWVRDGGTLVTIGAATEFARSQLELIALRSWYDTDDGKEQQRFDVPGAMFQATLDRGYWLSAGYDAGTVPVLVDSDRLYLPPEGPVSARRRVVATYGPLLSGHAWQETQDRIPGAVFLYEERVGRGRVIAFAEDPNYRGYARGMNRLFLNAVVLGPSAR